MLDECSLQTNLENPSTQQSHDLKVLFVPWYLGQNPYQERLAEQLSTLGVSVEGSRASTATLAQTVKDNETDILHLHWLQHFYLLEKQIHRSILKLILFIFQLLLIRFQGIKIVWTIHDLKNPMNDYLILDYLGAFLVSRIAHRIIVHSETAKESVVKKFLILRKTRLYVTPHASYIGDYENSVSGKEARQALDLSNSELVFLFFGLIFPYKGALELAQAFTELNQPNSTLVIAGRPMDLQLGQQIEAVAAVNSNIRYIPEFIPDEKVQVYMNACDVVAFPYKQSLTSGALSLAMSFGKACLAPKFGYLAEILDEKGAIFYDPSQEDGLRQALCTAIKNQSLLPEMGKYNYDQARQATWQAMATLTLNAYL
jgi:glycosyltransferase involved in cell wall biosynthesis